MTDYYETIVHRVEESEDASDNIFIGIEENKSNEPVYDEQLEENRKKKWSKTMMYMKMNKQ